MSGSALLGILLVVVSEEVVTNVVATFVVSKKSDNCVVASGVNSVLVCFVDFDPITVDPADVEVSTGVAFSVVVGSILVVVGGAVTASDVSTFCVVSSSA